MRLSISAAFLAACFAAQALGLASYDEYRDADDQQSGYLPNHNMDPSVVDSATFGLLWTVGFNYQEQFYAKPLTYTPLAGGSQLVFLASSQNWIRTLDAKTGALINARQVHPPFLQSDIPCGDIVNYIGIIGTPVIDPSTDTVHFFSKTYIPNFRVPGNTGYQNGVYYFHSVDINTLVDTGPPVLIDGSFADNDPLKYFVGGIILQRPSLTQINNVVYGAFGGHCDLFNYTGLVIGVDVVQRKIVTEWAVESVESGPLAEQSNILNNNGGGGEGGIWMSGGGIATDGQRLFVVTGNGDADQNLGAPATGSSGCQTLGEAAINLAVDSSTGVLSLSDYFQPYDYPNMDAGDQDFGSGCLVLLDPATFSGGGVTKMAVTAGKNGKVYILNANNLGGYKLGPGQTDNVLQTITTDQAVFGAAGSYPLEGGYVYVTPVGYPTYAYQLGFTQAGLPQFSLVGETKELSTGRVGVGIPTITSLNNQPGTGILWMTDPDAGIRAWYAVPENGVLVNIPLPQIPGVIKFQRPAFGDGRVYTSDFNGNVYCLGSPVNLPLNCSTPVDFGQVALGSKATQIIHCTANIAVTQVDGLVISDTPFTASNSSLPSGPLAKGQTFSFPVTWDLTNATVSNINGSYPNVTPGIKSAALTLITTNGVGGFATSFPISLTGTEVSTKPFLSVTPTTVDYGGIVVIDPMNVATVSSIITIANKGLTNLTILGYGYTTDDLDTAVFTNSTLKNGSWDLGYGFTAATLPPVGGQIGPNTAISVPSTFDPINGTGFYTSYWQVWSDGGSVNIILEGSASTAPVANLSISTNEGGWLPTSNLLMDFGNVAPGSSSSLQIRLCNSGGSALIIDKSKPPTGVFRISDPTELHETQSIPPNQCAYGTVLMVTNTEEYNMANLPLNNSWTLNTNDDTWGIHIVQITGTVVDTKIGPTNSTGQTVYNYLGCFKETPGRLFPNEPLSPNASTMDNTICMNACYGAAQYGFAATENSQECWCGNTPPPLGDQDLTDTLCNFACPGDGKDSCGGNGYLSVYYDPTKYVAGTDPSLYGPQTIKSVGGYVFQGCYSEGTGVRALSGSSPSAPSNGFSIESCQVACTGFTYFGMEYANQCYCGNTLGAGSTNQTSLVPAVNGCNMPCAGNALEYCGGGNRLNLYKLNGTVTSPTSTGTAASITSTPTPTLTPASPYTVTIVANWTYLGCYSEATNTRALNLVLDPVPAALNTVENCGIACSGFEYFGVEYSAECYCGNVIESGSVNQTSSDPAANGCSMTCNGNPSEYCGGPNRLNMYQAKPLVSSTSSSTVSTSSSATSSSSTVSTSSSPTIFSNSSATTSLSSSSSSNSTSLFSSTSSSSSLVLSSSPSVSSIIISTSAVSSSTSVTSSLNSPSATPSSSSLSSSISSVVSSSVSSSILTSTTSSSKTLSSISSTILSSSTPSNQASSTVSPSISFTSAFSSSQSSTQSSNSQDSSTLKTDTSSSLPSTTSTLPWSGSPTPGTSIGTWQYLGCANETSGRALSSISYSSSSSMTIEACQSFCTANNYALAGVEYASQCFCANTFAPGSALGQSGCSKPCTGASTEICGGNSRLNVFNNTAYVYPSSPAVVQGYAWKGCYSEASSGRLLSQASYSNKTSMTVESCVSFCAANGLGVAGVEYAQECYCAASLPSTAVAASNGSCNMLCKGNNKEFCGAGNLLDIYVQQQAGVKRMRVRKGLE